MLEEAKEICPTTTRRKISEGALIVDVREQSEVDQLAFDVPDIVVIPLSELEQRFVELPRERELVLVCQHGVRSLKATYFLMYQGYTKVFNMQDGMAKWVRKGFPVKGDASAAEAIVNTGGCGSDAPPKSSSCCG